MPGRDTRTSQQGIFARHQEGCGCEQLGRRPDPAEVSRACNCRPSYYGVVWDRERGRPRKTRRFRKMADARTARRDLERSLSEGTAPTATAALRLDEACERFVRAARDGVIVNKWGRRYRSRAVDDLASALAQIPEDMARRRLDDVRRGDVQRMIDDLAGARERLDKNGKPKPPLSGSRIRSIANALRSLYRWAQDRELASNDPAARIRLPAMDSKPRDRVADPVEFARLLDCLPLADALPYALAGYGTARHQEIRVLDWSHVSFDANAVELAGDEAGRKGGSASGSWRVVPLVKPLRIMLRNEWIAQGRPKAGKVCPPRKTNSSGLLSLQHVQNRVRGVWADRGLEPIGLHESRHTAATWLDHAGVSPKVASQLMGHRTPDYQPGAAPITLRRYTHTLPGELERARDQLDAFLAERTKEATG